MDEKVRRGEMPPLMEIKDANEIERMTCEAEYPPTNQIVLAGAIITRKKAGLNSPCIVGWMAQLLELGSEAHEKAIAWRKEFRVPPPEPPAIVTDFGL